MSGSILWFRRDLRLSDHRALRAACETGPVYPLFIRDAAVDRLGAAPKWRLEAGLARLAGALDAAGSRLILRSGDALDVLQALIEETGAEAVHWHRLYDRQARARDERVKTTLTAYGIKAQSHAGHLLFEPWQVQTAAGAGFKVFTPFWKAMRGRDPGTPLLRPPRIGAPDVWPESEALESWGLGRAMQRGAAIVARYEDPGEAAAQARLEAFTDGAMAGYGQSRDALGESEGSSGLSGYLSLGEVSARQVWAAAFGSEPGPESRRGARPGGEGFLRQLGWREFAWHLLFHSPDMPDTPWRPGWADFPWQETSPAAQAWTRGQTGVDLVDAAMRELYVTGRMQNRARMVVASYLTKHLMVDWRFGQRWFEDCLTDWDVASNALGWQWVAGCGPDAAPFFRIFNPERQAAKFDPDGRYRQRWLAEGQARPPATALAFFEAVPKHWRLHPDMPRPAPAVTLRQGRERALAAWRATRG
ncbi:cryptochrome/photolyase family protein [Aquicoccus sp. G2-2]|uniref:cryptochrome/photolyase family protein n=1 Tax=Aquicoccus sp. G2-2 TaxID=3092120 RepID=UPI002AE04DF9|nr:deoxyribodipyrimidine photo-lyase [Aquicoccus sp. G2-2]MEA1113415.1 deoxyribodipyrimidine photo-lyase [Aquicoccus sp. G2-2]